jgi:hypothetical protein
MCRKRVPCCKPDPVSLLNGQAPKLPCDINVPPDEYHRARKNAAFMPAEQVRANSQQKRGPVLSAWQLNDSRATKRPISEDPPRQAQHYLVNWGHLYFTRAIINELRSSNSAHCVVQSAGQQCIDQRLVG